MSDEVEVVMNGIFKAYALAGRQEMRTFNGPLE
jgi:hypothetical protein